MNSKMVKVRKLTRRDLLWPPKPRPSGRSDSPSPAQREMARKPCFFGVPYPRALLVHCWDGGRAAFFFFF